MERRFDDYIKDFGLDEYPFSVYTAERERDKAAKLFVKPKGYSILESVLKSGGSAIIVGNRGSGKTLILDELSRDEIKQSVVIRLDNFEMLSISENSIDYHNYMLKSLVDQLMVYLVDRENLVRKLNNDDKLFLSFLIYKYGDHITEKHIKDRIEKIQLSKIRRYFKKYSRLLRGIMNYGATTITNFGNELITKHFGTLLPNVDEAKIKNILPEIEFAIDENFLNEKSSYSLINKTLILAKTLNIKNIIIQIDRLDEDSRLQNDAELVARFIEPLFIGNQLLLNEHVQMVISVWKIPFDLLKSKFRKQKHFVYPIIWNKEDLEAVLNQRLSVYSGGKISSYKGMLDAGVGEDIIANIFALSNSNPRDLWHIWNEILKVQYGMDSTSKKIMSSAIKKALEKFVISFDFYEYYPKKKNARKNSNDVYSYIQHLLKLSSIEFTPNQLREESSTGGSAAKYITGMQNIGLIIKLSKKKNGSVLYRIKDPKVIYALNNNLLIEI